jgi:Sugar transferases involved in lipopolysaccharide synthesis
MKRVLDIIVSFTLLIILSPLIAALTVIIRFKLGSPVFFTQIRSGLEGRPFKILKFRTMTEERDSSGQLLPDELRLTSLGAWMRKYSLDELPQLWNVLKGDMSLVGPRPLLMEYVPLYTPDQARRLLVKPGITGWAQVNGRNAITWEQKFELDVWYVDHRTFWLDIKILLITLKKVLNSEGIAEPGHLTMSRFTGSGNRGESLK